jgi:DNA-binding NarL/FixJ family response regulator
MAKQRDKSKMTAMIRVFIFEDEWMCREALVAVLDKEAALEVVGTAADVGAGLTTLPETKPDVVLMDLRFNGELKGIQATRRIREMSPQTKVIIFTDFPEDVRLTEAVQAGSSGFLDKKEVQDPAILVEAIHSVHKGHAYFTNTAATKAVREIRRLANALTDRELEVLKIMAEGADNHGIAERLGISERTVANHVSSILSKFYAKNRTEAVAVARRERLIT